MMRAFFWIKIDFKYVDFDSIKLIILIFSSYMKLKLGICQLCEEKKELRESHIIPRSVFKRTLKGFNYGRILDRDFNKVINDQDQWATYLLCGSCEHNLNFNFEQYSLAALRGESKNIKLRYKSEYLQIINIQQNTLILYVISILWRALVSKHKVFKNLEKLNLDIIVKTYLQQCIKHKVIPRNKVFSVRISKLVTTMKEFQNIKLNFISNFTYNLHQQKFIRFLIIFEGYCFEVFLHTNQIDTIQGVGVLGKNKRILKIPYIDAFTIPELQKSLSDMVDAK